MLLFTLVFGTLANASPTFIQTDGKDYSDSSYGIQNGRSNNNAVEKEVDLNGWGHVGHFIQNICLSSMEYGLGTCLQESWSMYPETAQKIVNFSESEILWCGIALGYPNFEHAINTYRTPREDLKDFAKFLQR